MNLSSSVQMDIVPAGFERVFERIQRFTRGNETDRLMAWQRLLDWKAKVAEVYHKDLPAPLVFTTEDGDIDFEWRGTDRSLDITALPDGGFEYLMVSSTGSVEGIVKSDEVVGLLSWLVG